MPQDTVGDGQPVHDGRIILPGRGGGGRAAYILDGRINVPGGVVGGRRGGDEEGAGGRECGDGGASMVVLGGRRAGRL